MSHELEIKNGKASMFSVGETPWHGEGHIIAAAPTFDEALALANIGYEVEKRPTFREVVVNNEDGQPFTRMAPNEKAFVTVRTDTGLELGAVGPDYTPLQNADAFRALEPLLDMGICQLETGGVLRDGADAWLLARFDMQRFGPVVQEVFGDEVVPFALLTNNHSGRRNATVAETPIRVVCANTLGMAEHNMDRGGRYIGVRHTGDATTRMIEAAETLFKGLVDRYELVAQQYKLLKGTLLTASAFKSLILDTAIPDPKLDKRFNPEAKTAELVLERYQQKVQAVTTLWYTGKGHVGDASAWEAYNGLVQAIDHDTDLFPTRGGAWRTQSLMDGTLGKRKQAALNAVVAYASGEREEMTF